MIRWREKYDLIFAEGRELQLVPLNRFAYEPQGYLVLEKLTNDTGAVGGLQLDLYPWVSLLEQARDRGTNSERRIGYFFKYPLCKTSSTLKSPAVA